MEASCTNRTTRDNVVRNDVALGFDLGGRQGRKANRIGTLKSQINHSILCESGQSITPSCASQRVHGKEACFGLEKENVGSSRLRAGLRIEQRNRTKCACV